MVVVELAFAALLDTKKVSLHIFQGVVYFKTSLNKLKLVSCCKDSLSFGKAE